MDASARRVHAERSRRRLPRRLRSRRIGVRIAGLLGTAALMGVAVVIALMVMPRHHSRASAVATPTPSAKAAAHRRHRRRSGLTRAQLAERRAAVAELRNQGYSPLNVREYDPKTVLRVLIGVRGDGARLAFFFVNTHYVGHDALTPSRQVSVVHQTEHTVTLAYRLYNTTDAACCPQGPRATVQFLWDSVHLVPLQTVPSSYARLQSG